MGFSLMPDYVFEHFYDVTPDFLLSIGVRGVILDIDNTLEPYENSAPGERVLKWFEELSKVGISCAFVSNNSEERVSLFNSELNFPAFPKARKPFKKNVIKAMDALSSVREKTVIMGDQIFTDVWAAKNAGIRSILVSPIKDKRDIFTKFKRLLEKPILKKYEKRNNR